MAWGGWASPPCYIGFVGPLLAFQPRACATVGYCWWVPRGTELCPHLRPHPHDQAEPSQGRQDPQLRVAGEQNNFWKVLSDSTNHVVFPPPGTWPRPAPFHPAGAARAEGELRGWGLEGCSEPPGLPEMGPQMHWGECGHSRAEAPQIQQVCMQSYMHTLGGAPRQRRAPCPSCPCPVRAHAHGLPFRLRRPQDTAARLPHTRYLCSFHSPGAGGSSR